MATRKTSAKLKAEVTAQPVEAAVEAVRETVEAVEQAVTAGTKAASNGYNQAAATASKQVAQASKAGIDGYGDINAMGRENIDAVVKSGAVMVKGMETLGQEIMAFAKASIEGNIAAANAVFGARSVNEAVDLQTQFARKSFDQAVAESAKLTEMSIKVTNEAAAPIQARVNLAVDQVMKPLTI